MVHQEVVLLDRRGRPRQDRGPFNPGCANTLDSSRSGKNETLPDSLAILRATTSFHSCNDFSVKRGPIARVWCGRHFSPMTSPENQYESKQVLAFAKFEAQCLLEVAIVLLLASQPWQGVLSTVWCPIDPLERFFFPAVLPMFGFLPNLARCFMLSIDKCPLQRRGRFSSIHAELNSLMRHTGSHTNQTC